MCCLTFESACSWMPSLGPYEKSTCWVAIALNDCGNTLNVHPTWKNSHFTSATSQSPSGAMCFYDKTATVVSISFLSIQDVNIGVYKWLVDVVNA